jgi:hypothetical protein
LVQSLRELAPTAASFVGQVSDLIRLFTTIFGRFAASIGIDFRHAAQRAMMDWLLFLPGFHMALPLSFRLKQS